jgi:hypothetical protein
LKVDLLTNIGFPQLSIEIVYPGASPYFVFFREEIHYNNINDEIRKKKTLNIQAAMKRFAQKGHHAASRREIAEQCGMAKGSIYNYFKSKEEIAVSISL